MKKSNTVPLIIVGVVILVVIIGVTVYFTVFHKPNTGGKCFENGIDYFGNNIPAPNDVKNNITTAANCQNECAKDTKCKYWTYEPSVQDCWLKTSTAGREKNAKTISGPKVCP